MEAMPEMQMHWLYRKKQGIIMEKWKETRNEIFRLLDRCESREEFEVAAMILFAGCGNFLKDVAGEVNEEKRAKILAILRMLSDHYDTVRHRVNDKYGTADKNL